MTAYNFFLRDQHLKTTKELEEKARREEAAEQKKVAEGWEEVLPGPTNKSGAKKQRRKGGKGKR